MWFPYDLLSSYKYIPWTDKFFISRHGESYNSKVKFFKRSVLGWKSWTLGMMYSKNGGYKVKSPLLANLNFFLARACIIQGITMCITHGFHTQTHIWAWTNLCVQNTFFFIFFTTKIAFSFFSFFCVTNRDGLGRDWKNEGIFFLLLLKCDINTVNSYVFRIKRRWYDNDDE